MIIRLPYLLILQAGGGTTTVNLSQISGQPWGLSTAGSIDAMVIMGYRRITNTTRSYGMKLE